MSEWKTVKGKEAYGRTVSYKVCDGKCDVCGEQKKIMESDGSDDEYCSFEICKDCFVKEIDA